MPERLIKCMFASCAKTQFEIKCVLRSLVLCLICSSAWGQVGNIQIVLDSRPNAATNFIFSTTIPPGTNFTLDDDANPALPNTILFSAIPVGSYTVTQNTTSATRVFYSLSCTGDVDSGSIINFASRSVSIDLDAGETIVCTFVNAQLPRLQLSKVSQISVGTFNFNITNADTNIVTVGAQNSAAITTVSAGAAVTYDANTVANGTQNINILNFTTPIVVSELQTSGFALQAVAGTTCTITNGTAAVVRNILNNGTTAGTLTISNLVPSNAGRMLISCLFDNGAVTDLAVTINDGVASVISGAQTTYAITVTNNGPRAANGAQLVVPSVTGLSCAPGPITCSSTGGAVCPVGLTVSQLQSGVAIPTLPNAGALTINLTCGVTATGF